MTTFTIVKTRHRTGQTYVQTGTLAELIQCYSYTLECGASYQHEKGNKKINRAPKSIDTLIKNLNNAVNNSAANGYAGETYKLSDALSPAEERLMFARGF
jgi:hypothetical protein